VLDPFFGVGSTLIAAENTGRVCCDRELDSLTVNVIIGRYEALTGAIILADTARLSNRYRRDDERRI
jgi:DNA modification methylase